MSVTSFPLGGGCPDGGRLVDADATNGDGLFFCATCKRWALTEPTTTDGTVRQVERHHRKATDSISVQHSADPLPYQIRVPRDGRLTHGEARELSAQLLYSLAADMAQPIDGAVPFDDIAAERAEAGGCVVSARYLVVRRRENADWDEAYAVVDTDTTGSDEGRLVVASASNADAHLIASSLNGEPERDVVLAKRALVTIHSFIERQLDPDPSPDWGAYYTSSDEIEFVNQVQHQHQEPF